MAKHKARLISLLIIEAELVAFHVALRAPAEASASPAFAWHFWAALIVGVAPVGYALSIRCPVQAAASIRNFAACHSSIFVGEPGVAIHAVQHWSKSQVLKTLTLRSRRAPYLKR
jgi:hypothetical protein